MKAISTDTPSLNDRVYESIRDAIMLGELTPDSLHSVYEVAARLQVSRTPVREAFIRLADQGMLRIERNKGARILQTSAHDLEEIYAIRLMLEPPATFRATELADAAFVRRLKQSLDRLRKVGDTKGARERLENDAGFHRVILQASGNRRLSDYVDSLRDLQMIRGASTEGRTRELDEIYRDHEAIYDHVVAGDARAAALAMREHIATTSRLLLSQEAGETDPTSKFSPPWLDALEGLA